MKDLHTYLWPGLLLAFLLVCSAFFSCAETALISVNKIRLKHKMNKGSKQAKSAYDLILNLDKLITTVLVGNNIANTAIAAVGTVIFVSMLGERLGVICSTVFIAVALLVFGEITPKLYAVRHAEEISLASADLVHGLIRLFSPVVKILSGLSNFFLRLLGSKPRHKVPLLTEDEIKLMIDVGKEEGFYGDQERKMLERIFEFGDIEARDVMIPREEMASIGLNASPEELLRCFVEEGYSRLPVYEGAADNVVGIIYAKDLLYLWQNNSLIVVADIVHPAYLIPPDTRVNLLLRYFQQKKLQIAVVVDKGGKAMGLVTIEDLLEEIVGEIEEERNPIRRRGKQG